MAAAYAAATVAESSAGHSALFSGGETSYSVATDDNAVYDRFFELYEPEEAPGRVSEMCRRGRRRMVHVRVWRARRSCRSRQQGTPLRLPSVVTQQREGSVSRPVFPNSMKEPPYTVGLYETCAKLLVQ